MTTFRAAVLMSVRTKTKNTIIIAAAHPNHSLGRSAKGVAFCMMSPFLIQIQSIGHFTRCSRLPTSAAHESDLGAAQSAHVLMRWRCRKLLQASFSAVNATARSFFGCRLPTQQLQGWESRAVQVRCLVLAMSDQRSMCLHKWNRDIVGFESPGVLVREEEGQGQRTGLGQREATHHHSRVMARAEQTQNPAAFAAPPA